MSLLTSNQQSCFQRAGGSDYLEHDRNLDLLCRLSDLCAFALKSLSISPSDRNPRRHPVTFCFRRTLASSRTPIRQAVFGASQTLWHSQSEIQKCHCRATFFLSLSMNCIRAHGDDTTLPTVRAHDEHTNDFRNSSVIWNKPIIITKKTGL